MCQQNTKDLIESIEHFQNQHVLFNVHVTTFHIIGDLGQVYINVGLYMAFLCFKPDKPDKPVEHVGS